MLKNRNRQNGEPYCIGGDGIGGDGNGSFADSQGHK